MMMAIAERRDPRHDWTRRDYQRRRLISKLRWMGLEQEADRMTAASETPAPTTLPEETD